MSSRKQLLVLFTTVPLLMFGATTGVVAQPEFDRWCKVLKGTGAGYGLCRAGVAVGCADDSGNAQACANIEYHFQTVTGLIVPWLADACPCDFEEDVDKGSPPWVADGGTLHCSPPDISRTASIQDDGSNQTLIATGLLDANALSCRIDLQGEEEFKKFSLNPDENEDCLQKLNEYWDALKIALADTPGFDWDDRCSDD